MKTLSSVLVSGTIAFSVLIAPSFAFACISPTQSADEVARTRVTMMRHPSKRTLEMMTREGWKPKSAMTKVGY